VARSRGWDAVRSHQIAKAALMAEIAAAPVTHGARERSGVIDQLCAALVASQAEMPAVPKDSVNPFYSSNYADLADIVKVATPVITKHGLAVSQFVSHDEDRDTLVTWLLHSSGQFIADEMLLHLPKDDPQGQGSAITYAKRYAYQAALGIVADDDDDGNTASRSAPAAKAKPSSAAAKPCALCDGPLTDGRPVVRGADGMVHKACLEADEAALAAKDATQ
jgi:hypothetical protein